MQIITDIHTAFRGTSGVRRVHADLLPGGRDSRVCRKSVEGLMRAEGLIGVHRRRWQRHRPPRRSTTT